MRMSKDAFRDQYGHQTIHILNASNEDIDNESNNLSERSSLDSLVGSNMKFTFQRGF